MKRNSLAVLPLRNSLLSGSVLDSCVSLLRDLPRNSPPSSSSFAVFAHEALVARPGLNQGSVHAEVLLWTTTFLVCLFEHRIEEGHHRIVLDEPLAVLVNTVGTHTASSIDRPMNQRNSSGCRLRLLHQLAL